MAPSPFPPKFKAKRRHVLSKIPAEVLSPFVESYFIWEPEQHVKNGRVIESPPTGFWSIVFNYGDPYFLQNKKYERLRVPQQFIAGQSIYSCKLSLQGAIGLAGIVLKPAALASFFGLKGFDYTEERIDPLKALYHDAFAAWPQQTPDRWATFGKV